MRSLKLFAALMLVGATAVAAQSPTFGLGRTPAPEEVLAWDISISPTGEELPEGSGTAIDGALVYRRSCARCHGGDGMDGDAPRSVKSARGNDENPCSYGRVLPNHAPSAPTVSHSHNRAIHPTAICPTQHDPDTRAYPAKKTRQAKTKREARRSPKRHIPPRLSPPLEHPPPTP